MPELKLEHIVVGPIQANCFILGDRGMGKAVIIDPGDDAEFILERISTGGWDVVAVLNTHAHFDHTGGNARVIGALGCPLLVSRLDAPHLSKAHLAARIYGLEADASPPPDRLLDDGDLIQVGGAQLGVMLTPGHSPGGVTFTSPLGLFSGDTLFAGSIGRTDLPGGDYATLIASIRGRILPMPDDTQVFPGHGPFTTVGRERGANPFLR